MYAPSFSAMLSVNQIQICPFHYITSVPHLPPKYRVQQPPHPTFLIAPTIFLFSTSSLSSHSVSHTSCHALYRVLSCAPTAPVLPPGNLVLSFYIPRSDYGLYYCFPLSAPISIPCLSDFALHYPFRKGLLNSGKWLFLLLAIIFRH